jgi:hypothetical protein
LGDCHCGDSPHPIFHSGALPGQGFGWKKGLKVKIQGAQKRFLNLTLPRLPHRTFSSSKRQFPFRQIWILAFKIPSKTLNDFSRSR